LGQCQPVDQSADGFALYFLHRDWIRRFASDAGLTEPRFTDGSDNSTHPAFWQALAIMEKPA
jgi:hypothetical protein